MRLIATFTIFFLVVALYYQLDSSPLCVVSLPPLPSLPPNTELQKAQQISFQSHPDLRPEGFAMHPEKERTFFSGLGNGMIVEFRVDGPSITIHDIVRTGSPKFPQNCGKGEFEAECGRPLGMEYHQQRGTLIVCDTLGLLEVDINKRTVVPLLTHDNDGNLIRLCNDVEISKDGLIFFSDSSTQLSRKDVLRLVVSGCPTGRLFSFDPTTQKLDLIAAEFNFANGLYLYPDEEEILVVETLSAKITRVSLKNATRGNKSVFVDNLPAFPDNIHKIHNHFWLGTTGKRTQPFSFSDFYADKVTSFSTSHIVDSCKINNQTRQTKIKDGMNKVIS
eukprot:TRINITY_DN3539_c0_g3_i2.p1 TRINITY_DN3539_c0_g3~~TRINITY_DN3539_c0_g3_i2.p1  ORF type:complete len:334 (+),score=69.48 TRINITY_DN3539_c0_g3_i2:66-1067(+)